MERMPSDRRVAYSGKQTKQAGKLQFQGLRGAQAARALDILSYTERHFQVQCLAGDPR